MIRHELIVRLELEAGGLLPSARVVYHTSHDSWDGKLPVIWICHALTANSDPEDWWPEMVGPGKAIDTEKNFVACVNMLGSAYGSEGPAQVNPQTGKLWLLDFPKVTVRDMVTASIVVRKALGVSSVDLLIGSSIGGFQAIEWAVTEPEVFKRCLFIATAPRVSPYLSATVEAQRMALEADPTFREARDLSGGAAGLKCARAQALISYRCFEGYGLTQFEADPDTLSPAGPLPMSGTRAKNWSAGPLTPILTTLCALLWTATTWAVAVVAWKRRSPGSRRGQQSCP